MSRLIQEIERFYSSLKKNSGSKKPKKVNCRRRKAKKKQKQKAKAKKLSQDISSTSSSEGNHSSRSFSFSIQSGVSVVNVVPIQRFPITSCDSQSTNLYESSDLYESSVLYESSDEFADVEVASELVSVRQPIDQVRVLDSSGFGFTPSFVPTIFPSGFFIDTDNESPQSETSSSSSLDDLRVAYAGASLFDQQYESAEESEADVSSWIDLALGGASPLDSDNDADFSEHFETLSIGDADFSENFRPPTSEISDGENFGISDYGSDGGMVFDPIDHIAAIINSQEDPIPEGGMDEALRHEMYTRYQNFFGWDFPLCEEWIQRVKTMEMPAIISNHREYRRFRYYDLVRIKIQNKEDVDLQPLLETRVRFGVAIKPRDIRSETAVAAATYMPDSAEPQSILMVKNAPGRVKPAPVALEFVKTEIKNVMRCFILQMEQKALSGRYLSFSEAQHLIVLAHDHAGEFVENILRSFEGISSTGKRFISLINRLQALANRYMVLNEDIFRQSLKDPKTLPRLLETLFKDCTELMQEIDEFQTQFDRAHGYMQAHVDGLISHAKECLTYLDRFQNFLKVEHTSVEGEPLPVSNVVCDEQYTRYMKFLLNLKAKRIFRFLVGDFDKMFNNTRNIVHSCQDLLAESELRLNEINPAA